MGYLMLFALHRRISLGPRYISELACNVPLERESDLGTALSDEARKLLLEASKDPYGIIEYWPTKQGLQLFVGLNPFGVAGDVRWRFVLQELSKQSLVKIASGNLRFRLTRQGSEAAKALANEQPEAEPLNPNS